MFELEVDQRLDKLERLVSDLKQQQRAAELKDEAARVETLERHRQIMSALQSRGSGGGIEKVEAASDTSPHALAMTSSGEQKIMMILQGIVSSMNRYTRTRTSFFLFFCLHFLHRCTSRVI